MPNWTEQTLHVVGSKADVDRFVRTGFVRRNPEQWDDVLDFMRLCPLGRRERKDTYTHPSGVVLEHCRTKTQAMFTMITSWDYPAEFYARLAKHWPSLGFVCAVNGEMGDFGGVLMALDGEAVNLVKDYTGDYSRRTHGREIRALLKRWMAFLTADRAWRLEPEIAWERRSVPFDAHFDDNFSFYFRSRADMAAFRKRYRTSSAMGLVDGEWKSVRFAR